MKKLYKRFFALFLALAMVLALVPAAFAESQDGLSVDIVTDKESYQVGDEAAVTVVAKNTGTKVISNIEVEIELPQGITFKEGYSNIVKFDKLEPGDEQRAEVKGEVKKETPVGTGDTAPTMLLMLLAAASAVTAVIFMKKKNRNAVSICMGVLILSLAGLTVPVIVSAAVTNAEFTLEKAVKVDGKDRVIKAKVSYQYEGEEDETTVDNNNGNDNTGDDNNTSTGVTAKHVSVHDPSIIKDGDTYYIFGTHRGWAKSDDLITWTTFTNNLNNDIECNNIFKDAAAWAALGDSNYEVTGNLWAPDVIYNKDMKKWCMYMSVNGNSWYSSIVLLTADSLDGDWTYEGPVVYSGFVNNPSAANLAKTDFTKVTKETTVPERYMEKSQNGQVLYSMNAIDPCVFYDEDGTLWMSYGSWFGGIYMLKLDPSTGLRDYNHTYETVSNESDIYQGIKLAGGTNVSGEASYIQYVNGYYYLFMTYGGLTANGGYNMRVFRSENVTGPYVDALGHDARRGNNTNAGNVNGSTGVRLMSYYKWSHMDYGYCAQGHNSAFVDDDGKIYVIYHTRFNNRDEAHEVRVHQLFQTEDGWLIAAPYEYTGETLPEAGYEAEKAVGTYEVLIHNGTNFEAKECVTGQMLTLSEDGKVSGAMTGSWVQKAGTPYVTITLDGVEYNGVFIEQTKEGTSETVMCFTLLGKTNELAIWGSKLDTDDEQMLKDDMEMFTMPTSAISDLTLETTGFYGSSITYESSNPAVLSNNGKVVRGEENQTVTMKVTFTKGEASDVKSYPITIIGTGSVEDGRILVAEYYTDNAFDLSKDGVTVPNPYNKTVTAGLEIYKGVSIEFDVEGSGGIHSNILSFNNDVSQGGNLLYFTGGSYLGYNATGGFFDANRNNEKDSLYHDYINGKAHIRIDITNSGFEVYVNNAATPAYSNKTLPAEALGTSEGFEGYSVVLPWLNTNAMQLSFGTGNWWPDKFNGTIKNVKLYANETENAINEWQSAGYGLSNISYDDGMVVFNRHGQSGARGVYTTFKDAYKFTDSHKVEFDFLMSANHSGSGSSNNEIVITGKGASYKANGTTTTDSNYILKLSTSSSGTVSTTYTVNDSNQTVEIPSNEWVHLSVITDADGDVKAVLTYKDNSSATVYTHVNGSCQLDGISFLIGRLSNAGIGNISVEADNTDVPSDGDSSDNDTAPVVTAEVTGIAYPDKASDITVTFTGDKELSDKYPVRINGKTITQNMEEVDMMTVKSVSYNQNICTVELTMKEVSGWHALTGSYDIEIMNGNTALASENVSYSLDLSSGTDYTTIQRITDNPYSNAYYKIEGTKMSLMTIVKSDKIHSDAVAVGDITYGWFNCINSELYMTLNGVKYNVGSHMFQGQYVNNTAFLEGADASLVDYETSGAVRGFVALGTFDNDNDEDKGCIILHVVDLSKAGFDEASLKGQTITFSGFIGPNDYATNGDGTRFVEVDGAATYTLQ